MEPISLIVTALAAGAAAALQETTGQAIKDAYSGLRTLIVRRFGDKADVADAVEGLEKKPGSEGRKTTAEEELDAAGAAADAEILAAAQALIDLLEAQGSLSYTANVSGSGSAAQGEGAVAAGERGIAAGGDVSGGTFSTGDQINTGGGDYVGRDQIVHGDQVRGSKQTGNYNIHIENAQGLVIGDQSTATQDFAGAGAPAGGPARERDLRQRKKELEERYDTLTDRIAAVEKDLRRAMDSERKLTLRDRLAELVEDRKQVVAQLDEIERQLGI